MSTTVERLTARFADVSDQELADLDAEILRLQTIRALIVAGRAPVVTETQPGNLRPAAPQPAPRAQPGRSSNAALFDERRRKIAARLKAGPKAPKELADALGLSQFVVGEALRHPWFQKCGPKMRDPYQLTAAGLQALTEPPAR